MRKPIGLTVALLLTACLAGAQTSQSTTTTTTTTTTKKSSSKKSSSAMAAAGVSVQTLQAHEQMLLDAFRAKNADVFRKDLATNALMIDGGGISDRERILTDIASPECTISSATVTDPKILNVDRDSAVLYYTMKTDGKCGTNPVPGTVYASTLYNKRAGKWVPVFHQETVPQGRGM